MSDQDLSPLAPFRRPIFRMLWSTWLVANLCMWMNDVAAAWMMTSLTQTPIWVALVQTAATLPVFLLGLPSGALADSRIEGSSGTLRLHLSGMAERLQSNGVQRRLQALGQALGYGRTEMVA